jgi:four helix bundle protein
MDSFYDLEVWKKAREIKKSVRKLTDTFPIEEKYRLSDQIVRSSRSVTANIAEGFGRYTFRENLQFCVQARGSLTETLNHLIDAFDEGFIDSQILANYKKDFDECGKILNGYMTYLRTQSKKKLPEK